MTFNYYFQGPINCVRWSPRSDMLASAAGDVIAVLDFMTGKQLYTGKTLDGSNFHCFINKTCSQLIIRICYVCLFPLKKHQRKRSLREQV